MNQQLLAQPVEYGDDIRLAPTTELAGLAELAEAHDDDTRLATLIRVADSIRSEDAARVEMARLRKLAEQGQLPLAARRRSA